MSLTDIYRQDPANEALKYNQQPQGVSGVQHDSGDPNLARLVQIVEADRANKEKTLQILPTIGSFDGQILAKINVTFEFNSIVICAAGGIVGCFFGPITPDPTLTANNGVETITAVQANTQCNWLFGSNGISPGSAAGANAQPIDLFTGPQEIRFSERQRAQVVTFFVHPRTNLTLRGGIDPNYGTMLMMGAVEFLR